MAPKKTRLAARTSVRGAFGPDGAFGEDGRRRSSDSHVNKAQIFQLDRCLDHKEFSKIIYQFGSAAEARKTAAAASAKDEALQYDIRGFVLYLSRIKALQTLLFWKDAEEFTTLFGGQERKEAAKKVYERYLKAGAEYEVVSLKKDRLADLTKQLDDPPEDIFESLQQEAYGSMLFELFPRFWEEVKNQDREGKQQRSKLTAATTLNEVIQANDLEIHLFAEYCRAHLCEDCVIFILEVGMFSLLFDPSDLAMQGERIYKTYLDPKSEGRIVVSATKQQSIAEALKAAGVGVPPPEGGGQLGTASSVGSGTPVSPKLFEPVYEEVTQMLNMDVWPRYKEAVLAGGKGGSLKLEDVDATQFVDMTKPTKKAVAAALRNAEMTAHLRKAAEAQGVAETIDFCKDCMEYTLLFSDDDRRPRAKLIHETYLKAGCDTPVNVPHTMIQAVEKHIDKCQPDVFEECNQEMLQVIADNIFSLYLKEVAKQKELDAAPGPSPAAAKPSGGGGGGGGGCCILM